MSLAIATTIFFVVLFLISVIGLGVLGILLSLVDAIFILLGKKTPTQYLVELIAQTLYDIDLSITNLDSSNRLDIQLKDVDFVYETEGFRVSNSLDITMAITNTVKYQREFESDEAKVAKRNVFSYTLQTEPITFITDLPYWNDTLSDQWHPLNGRVLQTSTENNIIVPLATTGSGINQHLGVYYSEAFRSGYQACWKIPIGAGVEIEICDWKDFKDTIHYPLHQTLIFDIFPETVTEFARMEWSDTSPTIPIQADYDADGLSDLFGTDPNYSFLSGFDTDSDGMSDLYEVSNGYNATAADGDFDGLTDSEELVYGTNPFIADSDGDGLNDRIEVVDGWLIAYDGANLSLYLDGGLEAQETRTMEASTGVMWLGRHTNTNRYLNGAMDDVVILNEALSAGEIGDLMNGRFNPNDACWPPAQI